jgi:hypothetical protein
VVFRICLSLRFTEEVGAAAIGSRILGFQKLM